MKKLGMMKTILMMGCALALLFAAVPQPVMAANSQMNLTVGTTNDAKAGDTVTVRLVGSNNRLPLRRKMHIQRCRLP